MEGSLKINWQLQEVPIKNLKDLKKNPRQIRGDQLERLTQNIDKYGLLDKPIVNKDYTIICGHQRVRVFKRKKEKFITCMVSDIQLSDDDVDELCIGHNLHQGEFDYDILANEWDPLKLLEYGFSESKLLGMSKKAEEILEKENEKSGKKAKMCPQCGHEF